MSLHQLEVLGTPASKFHGCHTRSLHVTCSYSSTQIVSSPPENTAQSKIYFMEGCEVPNTAASSLPQLPSISSMPCAASGICKTPVLRSVGINRRQSILPTTERLSTYNISAFHSCSVFTANGTRKVICDDTGDTCKRKEIKAACRTLQHPLP